jgi:DNA primase
MATDSPDRYLMHMAKKDRGGRIFLDDRSVVAAINRLGRG